MQQNVRFDNVYVSPRVRVALQSVLETQYARKFWDLVEKLRAGNFATPGMRIERLHTNKGKVYSARINVDMRVIFSMYTDSDDGQRSLVLWDANHHDEAYDRIERTVIPTVFQAPSNFLEPEKIWSETDYNLDQMKAEPADSEELTQGLLLFRVPHYVLAEPERYRTFEKNIDRYLRLSEDQEDLLEKTDRAHLVRGSAGTGKTSLALFYALNLFENRPADDIYFFTYQEELACVCRCYKANLIEEQDGEYKSKQNGEEGEEHEHKGDFHVFSYIEFCRHYLRQHLDPSSISWKWIDRETSIKHLKEIIGARSRWARSLRADDLYSYIYSILKGRFVPGTDSLPSTGDDFRRIFKGYGTVPQNLEDILEIFGHYEERLKRLRQKDEADLIQHCYKTLKDRAVLTAAGKSVWIVIDEMQDFTELEWKSILLFWENQCLQEQSEPTYPFLCGDRNQNISRSGFRWQDVDSYIESILREIHRPNALQKVQLHRNFRNTKPIYELGVFVHSFAPDAGADFGLPSQLPGNKPVVLVGSHHEFVEFLTSINETGEEKMPAPMIILSEDHDALKSVRDRVVNDEGLFFMPLQVSKGLEFEDLISYRLFSSVSNFEPEQWSEEIFRRSFDLWYTAITRARQNLLIFITPEDLQRIKKLFGARYQDFLELISLKDSNTKQHLHEFYSHRERYLPNYAVIFLERTKANESWQQYRQLAEHDAADSKPALEFKSKALRLWKRCRDLPSLGRAYAELEEFEEAIPYFKKAALHGELGNCYEKLGKYELAAQSFKQEGTLLDAARCYEKGKDYDQAAQIYEQHHEWLQAATNYYLGGSNLKAAHCFEQAKMWQSAADLYRSKSNWLKAAELYQQADQHELAGDMYMKAKDKLDAARAYMRAKLPQKAAPIYEGLMRWVESAEAYEQSEQFDKAGVLYSKAGRLKEAARCKEHSGDVLSAASAYERMKQWDKAAAAYVQLDMFEKAAECFEQDKQWEDALTIWTGLRQTENAARCLDGLGRAHEAGQMFADAGMHNEAGHCFEKDESWADAADQYLKSGNFGAAASMLARIGRRIDAAKLYLLAGQSAVAVEVVSPSSALNPDKNEADLRSELIAWAEESKKYDLCATLYEALGQYAKAADKYRQGMKLTRAAECCEKAGDYELAAEYYLQEGKFENAAACFKQGQKFKRAAQCYELLKKWNEAREIYEQLADNDGIKRCETAANWL